MVAVEYRYKVLKTSTGILFKIEELQGDTDGHLVMSQKLSTFKVYVASELFFFSNQFFT